jgi:Glutathione S-transferase, C-terminal domain
VLNNSLRGKTWLVGEQLTIADFSIGALVPSAERIELRVGKITEILRWNKRLDALPARRDDTGSERCCYDRVDIETSRIGRRNSQATRKEVTIAVLWPNALMGLGGWFRSNPCCGLIAASVWVSPVLWESYPIQSTGCLETYLGLICW